MQLSYHFPTVISYKNDVKFTNSLISGVNDFLSDTHKTSQTGYTSSYFDHKVNQKLSAWVEPRNYAFNLAREFADKIGCEIVGKIDWSPFISNMKEGDSHSAHIHPQSIISGIFYIDVGENSSPIIFNDPRYERSFNGLRVKDKENKASQSSEVIHPRNGDILVWESWVPHMVPKNLSKYRKTLVWNLHRVDYDIENYIPF